MQSKSLQNVACLLKGLTFRTSHDFVLADKMRGKNCDTFYFHGVTDTKQANQTINLPNQQKVT